MKLNNNKLYDLLSQNLKTVYSKIELLSWDEASLGEIQGEVTGGNINLTSDSAIRRTLSMSMAAIASESYDITNIDNHISLNKKARIKIGVETPSKEGVHWFNLGIYILTSANSSNDINSGATLSITAIDKMGMLSGDISGQIQTPVELHLTYDTYVEEGEIKYDSRVLRMDEIIRYAVVGLGGENPAKVIINDVPAQIRSAVGYQAKYPMYLDSAYNPWLPDELGVVTHPEYGVLDEDNPPPGFRVIKTNDYVGYELTDFIYPGELVKQPGDTITSILDDIKNVLGNYEYFYDVDGNFIFQEIKNYRDKSFSTLVDLDNDSYTADFTKTPFVFSFKGKHIVSAYSNAPQWNNIKNDYVVWGMPKTGSSQPIMYHLAIDKKPTLPPSYTEPWQKYLIDYGDQAILWESSEGQVVTDVDPGRYYYELKGKFPQIYNLADTETEKKGWKEDYSNFSYYLDFIDEDSEFGKYSINTIGKRTISVTDDNVTIMYPPNVPDIIILLTSKDGEDDSSTREEMAYLNKVGLQFTQLPYEKWGTDFKSLPVGKDAFGVIRELLFYHTTYNETISLTSIPMYFLDVNQLIEVEDDKSNIYGQYLIKSISIPIGTEGTMSITGIRSTSRI